MIRRIGWKSLQCGAIAAGLVLAAALLIGPSLRIVWSESTGATRTIPAGTALTVHLIQPLDSKSSQPGDRFQARIVAVASLKANVTIGPGTLVEGRCVAARQAEGGARPGYLRLALSGLKDSRGDTFPLETTTLSQWGTLAGPRDEAAERKGALPSQSNGDSVSPLDNGTENGEATITPDEDLTFVLVKPVVIPESGGLL